MTNSLIYCNYRPLMFMSSLHIARVLLVRQLRTVYKDTLCDEIVVLLMLLSLLPI